ncbi:MAG TPA: hypothetical protein VFB66_22195 [Tepidisphaeraceae bacterium]|nr:hypothetical protein [Tepidisphaeraceae bacterium]
MNYRRAKRDGNHAEIVRALRDCGRSVLELHTVGGGCPDLLVGYGGYAMVLLEVKNPSGRDRVEESQRTFLKAWRGKPPVVVRSVDEALRACGIATGDERDEAIRVTEREETRR